MPYYKTKELHNGIVRECHAQFKRLPNHGKPGKRSNGKSEWTILAGIAMTRPIASEPLEPVEPTVALGDATLCKDDINWEVKIISLGTGSKCLPQGKQSLLGDLLNDSHAEVLARRGFNKWCLNEMKACIEDPNNEKNKFIFENESSSSKQTTKDLPSYGFKLVDPRIEFHLYVSQAPCGDATTGSLALVQSEESRNAFLAGQGQPMDHATSEPITGFKHGRDTTPNAAVPGEEVQPITKQSKLDPTSLIGSTEPQPVPTLSDTTAVSALVDKTISEKDSSLSSHAQGDCPCVLGFRRGRFDYNSVSVLRTKPGRVDSEPTLSMSCSDKIARWNLLGLTSALVTPFLKEPIFLSSLITLELFDAEALERALNQRTRGCGQHAPSLDSKALSGDIHGWPKTPRQLKISCTEIAFEYSKAEVQALSEKEDSSDIPVASGSSICWVVSSYSPTAAEVLVNGCKAGASTKKGVQPKSRSQLCKLNMFESSVALWDAVSKSIAPNPTAFQQLPQIVRTLLGWPRVTTQIEGNDKPILQEIVYRDWKALSPGYVAMKETLFQGLFRNWQRSDRSLESFNRHGKVITSTTIEK